MMHQAVAALLDSRRDKRVLAPLGPLAPSDEAAGYALQRQLAEATGVTSPFGFKIGATTAQMQAYLGLAGPAAGFVPVGGVHASGARLRYADYVGLGVECEVGVRLGRDIPFGHCGRDQAADAVAEVFPAIEIVEKRYADLAELGTPTLIADQVFHAGGVPGTPCPEWRTLDLGAVRGELWVDGSLRGAGHGRDLLGHPFEALAWLAGSGAAREFCGLRAGQIVWLGSVTPPIWLDGPCHVKVAFTGLGEVELTFT